MNTATVRGRRTPKHPPPSDFPAIATLIRDAQNKTFSSNDDDLRRRWEQIVSKGRS